jgi:hypothetical protein
MRVAVCLLVVAGIGAFIAYQHREATPVVVAEQKPAQVQPASSPAPAAAPQQNSPHDWMKNSLDRAADVKRQVQAQRKDSGDAYGR